MGNTVEQKEQIIKTCFSMQTKRYKDTVWPKHGYEVRAGTIHRRKRKERWKLSL